MRVAFVHEHYSVCSNWVNREKARDRVVYIIFQKIQAQASKFFEE